MAKFSKEWQAAIRRQDDKFLERVTLKTSAPHHLTFRVVGAKRMERLSQRGFRVIVQDPSLHGGWVRQYLMCGPHGVEDQQV